MPQSKTQVISSKNIQILPNPNYILDFKIMKHLKANIMSPRNTTLLCRSANMAKESDSVEYLLRLYRVIQSDSTIPNIDDII